MTREDSPSAYEQESASYTKCSISLCLVFCAPLAPFEGRVAHTADELKQIETKTGVVFSVM